MKYLILLSLILLFSTLSLNFAKTLPSYIKKCKKDVSTEELEECLIAAVASILPKLATEGIPELNLPPVEPLRLAEVKIDTKRNLEISYQDLEVFGFKNVEFKKVKLSFSEGNIEIQFKIPVLRVLGNYKIKGKLLLFELDTSGFAEVNITNFNADAIKKFEINNKNGRDFVTLKESSKLEINYTNSGLRVENLIPGNEQLSNQLNKMFNENIDAFSRELNPVVLETVTNLIEDMFFNPIFQEYSLDELFD